MIVIAIVLFTLVFALALAGAADAAGPIIRRFGKFGRSPRRACRIPAARFNI